MLRKVLLIALLGFVGAVSASCLPGRYASCNTNDDCPAIDGGKLVCVNLRCVECQYDGDCAPGSLCSANKTCEILHKPDKEEEPGPPATSLEECAKRCKGNPSCGDACRDQFKK